MRRVLAITVAAVVVVFGGPAEAKGLGDDGRAAGRGPASPPGAAVPEAASPGDDTPEGDPFAALLLGAGPSPAVEAEPEDADVTEPDDEDPLRSCMSCEKLRALCDAGPATCIARGQDATDACIDVYAACPEPPRDEPVRDEPAADDVEMIGAYASFPYEAGSPGYVRKVPFEKSAEHVVAGRVRAEGGYAGAGVWRSGGELELWVWRFGLAADLVVLTAPHERKASYVGSFVAPLAIVMRPRVQWGIGPGLTYVADARISTPVGPSGSTRVDVLVGKPFVLSGRLDVGRLRAKDTDLGSRRPYTFTARGQAGVLWRRWELYGGYAYKTIGNRAAYGPVAGVRAWF